MPKHVGDVSQYIIMCGQFGSTPLIRAAERGHTEVAVELIKAGAEIDHKNKVRVR